MTRGHILLSQIETSLFVASYDSQGHGGGIRPRLHTGTALCWAVAAFISTFTMLYTDGMTPWTGDQPVARLLSTHMTAQKQNKRTQIHMPRVGFEPMTPVFKRARTVHVLDRAATVTGPVSYTGHLM
jgi:hypothetical protein